MHMLEKVIPPVQKNILMSILPKERRKNNSPGLYFERSDLWKHDPNVVYESYAKAASMDSVL